MKTQKNRFITMVSISVANARRRFRATTSRLTFVPLITAVCTACTLTAGAAFAQVTPAPESVHASDTAQDSSPLPAIDGWRLASAGRTTDAGQPGIGSLSLPRVLPLAVRERPSMWRDLFAGTWSDAKRLPSKPTLEWMTIGAVAAGVSRPADNRVGRSLSTSTQLHEVTESGAYIGSTPIQLGLGAATYFIGRARQSGRMTTVGAELVRAQLLSEGLTIGIKEAVRRNRPQGSGFAFPSGHTTVSFASATVLQQNFGWRVGGPAYAVASFVALSRVQMKRHYLSDVAFGAALGIAAGRTVAFGPSRRIVMTPTVVDGGGGLQFVWTK